MASFHIHASVGATASAIATAVAATMTEASHLQLATLFGFAVTASIMPDIDSDHSISARLVFNLLAIALALIAFMLLMPSLSLVESLIAAIAVGLCVRFIMFHLFTRITEHRGLFHSVPAALLAGLGVSALGMHALHWTASFSWLAGSFVSGGYLLHLMLDELYSVDLIGHRLRHSFGTALTLFDTRQGYAYLAMYAVVIASLQLMPFSSSFVMA